MAFFRMFRGVVVVTSLVACGGSESNEPPTNEQNLAVYTPEHRDSTGRTANLTCDAAEPTNGAPATSGEELMGRLDGIWLRCSGSASPFDGADGVEIDKNGRTFTLKRNAAGTLERRTGFANETFLEARQNGTNWDAYQYRGTGGFIPRFSSFSESGNTWKSDVYPQGKDLLVRTTEKVEAPPTGLPGARLGEAGCALPEAGVLSPHPTTAQLTERIHGRWIACGARFFDDAAGFEFTDTEWFALEQGAGSTLVRSTNPERHGTLLHSTGSSPSLITAKGGQYPTPMAVSTAPVKLQISAYGKTGSFVYSALP